MNTTHPSSHWQLQDAKAQFSAVVRQAQASGPQHISVHGKPAVVVLSQADFRRLQSSANKPRFTQLMRGSPLLGMNLLLERDADVTRHISLEQ